MVLWPSHSLLARKIIAYLCIGLLIFCAVNALGWFAYLTFKNQGRSTLNTAENPAGILVEKAAYYRTHTGDYNALFLGDSRTLCGMHPDRIDPVWRRTSYNLAHWATWLPSQYALISDIAPVIPKDTVVVWSVGHQNFSGSPIRAVYPPGWGRVVPMVLKGQPADELIMAQIAFTPALALVGRSQEFFDRITRLLSMPVYTRDGAVVPQTPDKPSLPFGEKNANAQQVVLDANPLTAYTEQWPDDQGRVASIAQYKTNGAMLRTELIPSFYRGKQKEDRESGAASEFVYFTPDERQIALFRDILSIFRDQGLTVIVNEFEETPYRYKTDAEKKKFRHWMRTVVKPIVEEYGFRYVHADEADLTNADYFDYNHLNDRGVARHNAVLARKLKALTR